MRRYSSWGQVAGHFDGDGTIGFSDLYNMPYKLGVSLVFTDQSVEQIANIKRFLNCRGIKKSNILKTSKGTANTVVVSVHVSVVKTLSRMLPHLCKKGNEAKATLGYYADRMTGDQLVAIFHEEVKAGRREKRPRRAVIDVPYTWTVGSELMKQRRSLKFAYAFGRLRAKVAPGEYERIREEGLTLGKPISDLVAEHPRYSKETIRRILGRGRGYVAVIGIGRVSTTDATLDDVASRRARPASSQPGRERQRRPQGRQTR